MATTKKATTNPTTAKQATTKKAVDAQDTRTRLWQSLSQSYDAKKKSSDESFDQAYSQADRQATARGMGRSSYNNQTLANLAQKKVEAQNDISSELIADYQNRLYQLERDEKADEQWQQQFNYQKGRDAVADRQWNKQFAYQQSRDKTADNQWNKQFAYQQSRDKTADNQWKLQFNYQQGRDKVSDSQWQKEFDEGVRQFNAQMAKYGSSGGGGYSRGGGRSRGTSSGDPSKADGVKASAITTSAGNNLLQNTGNAASALGRIAGQATGTIQSATSSIASKLKSWFK